MKLPHKILVIVCISAAVLSFTWFAAGIQSDKERRRQIMENQQKAGVLSFAALQYVEEHGDKYPDAARWEDQLRPYMPPGFSPGLAGMASHRFAMNRVFSNRNIQTMPPDAVSEGVLFFESVAAGPSANDELESVPTTGEGVVVAYANGRTDYHPAAWVALIKNPAFRQRILGQ